MVLGLAHMKQSLEQGAAGSVVQQVDPIPGTLYGILHKLGMMVSDERSLQRFLSYPGAKPLLANPKITKIFHFARFDLAALYNALGVMPQPVYCTKIASRLCRTYTDRHGLKDLVREVLNIDLSKQQQSSDWGAQALSEAQLAYAASDVLHLHALRDRLNGMLAREGRLELAQSCFDFLPTRARLDLEGWDTEDIFAHS